MIQAICWTLVHSLWQGLLFALVTGIFMLLTRQASAVVRYNVVCILFFLFLAVCGGTFLYELVAVRGGVVADAAGADAGSRMAAWMDALGRYCSEHAVPIVWGWLFIFSIKSLHMLGGYLYAQRVRHYGISAAPAEWQDKLDRMCRQMGIRRAVRLVESQVVKMPLVIGHMRPMILMPLGLVTGLPAGEIEAVLLHELAHISRNDYIVNFIQNVAGNIFFFNPGLLWMSSLMREERENCCDDAAIARTQNRAAFIQALISFKEHDLRLTEMANGFPGKKDQLVKRAMRIAQSTKKTLDPVEKVFLAVSFILISLLVAATSGSPSVMAVKMAHIPGERYRFVMDTPVPVKQVPVARPRAPRTEASEKAVMARKIVIDEEMQPDNEEEVLRQKEALDEAQGAILLRQQQDEEATQAIREKQLAIFEKDQATGENVQALHEKQQAFLEKEQALRDKRQAELDAQQAGRDAQQARRDATQAIRDKEQQRLDREQAARDRQQAISDKKPISP